MRKFDLNHKILLLIAIIMVALLVIPYADVVAISVLTAYFMSGWYQRRRTKKGGKRRALPAVWCMMIACWVVPLAGIGYVAVVQSQHILDAVSTTTKQSQGWEQFDERLDQSYREDQQSLGSGEVGGLIADDVYNEQQDLQSTVITLIESLEEDIAARGKKQIKRMPRYFISILLYFFLVTTCIIHGEYIYRFVRGSLPFSTEMMDMYRSRMTSMLDGIMRGSFITSIIQGICIGIAWWMAGLPYGITVTIIATILYIPMIGAMILVAPAAIYLFYQGQAVTAVLFFVWGGMIVGNIDNVIRHKFLSKHAYLNSSLLFLSIVSGMYRFGLAGLFYGPLLAIVALTTLYTYREGKLGTQEGIEK